MTVSTTAVSSDTYVGNGVTTAFPTGFAFLETDQVVPVEIVDGVETDLTTGFTVTGVGLPNGGTVTLSAALPTGKSLRIDRRTTLVQPVSVRNLGAFSPKTHEEAWNRLCMQIQEVAAKAGDLLLRDSLADPAVGSLLVGFLRTDAGAVSRTLASKLSERRSVLDFIDPALHAAIRAGTHTGDLLAQINTALAACAGGKAKLVFPPGDYYVSGPVNVTQNALCLEFEGRARLVTTSATAHILVIGDGATTCANVEVSGAVLTSLVAKSDGACIYVRNGNDVRINDLICATNIHDGVVFEGGTAQFGYYLENFLITGFSGDGIRQQAGSGIGVQDIHIGSGVIDGNSVAGTTGHRLLSGGGTYVRFVDVIRCENNVLTAPTAGNAVNYSFFDQVIADTAIADNWSLQDATGLVLSFNLSNCWGNSGARGFYSGGTATSRIRNVTVSNSVFANNTGNGVQLDRTDNHILTACQIGGNNTSNGVNGSGVLVAADCSNWSVTNCIIDRQFFAGINGNHYYGILVATGASDAYVISGNIIRRSITSGLLDGGTGTNKIVTPNVTTAA